MAYVVVFLSSALFGYLATRINPKTNRGLVFFCSIISILIPSVFAGLRDVSVGTDLTVYVQQGFDLALTTESFQQYVKVFQTKEPGYLFMVFLISKIFGNIQWLLFFFSFIIMSCVYIGIWNFREEISLPFAMLVYFFLYYNDSLNMIRQAMAMSIVFMALKWLLEKKYVKYFFSIAIAYLLHTTAIVAIVVFFVYWFLESKNRLTNRLNKNFRKNILVFVVVIFCAFFSIVFSFFVDIGLFNDRYLYYIQHDSVSDNTLDTLSQLIQVLFVLIFMSGFEKKDEKFYFFKTNLIYSFVTLQLARTMFFGHRISLYFSIINILFVPRFAKITNNQVKKLVINFIILSFYLFYWIYIYVVNRASETYPYIPYWIT